MSVYHVYAIYHVRVQCEAPDLIIVRWTTSESGPLGRTYTHSAENVSSHRSTVGHSRRTRRLSACARRVLGSLRLPTQFNRIRMSHDRHRRVIQSDHEHIHDDIRYILGSRRHQWYQRNIDLPGQPLTCLQRKQHRFLLRNNRNVRETHQR